MSQTNLLQNVYLFKGLNRDELNLIAEICRSETLAPGDEVFSEGDVAKALYIIKFGSVRIFQKGSSGDRIEIATMASGSHFGEMAFIDGEKRSASAAAIEKCEVVIIPFEKLKSVLDSHPSIAVLVYRALCHFLCGRLRLTTNDLSFAREKNLSHF